MAEAILRHGAQGRLSAASGGERVTQPVDLRALECLADHGISTGGLRSKPWGQFFGLGRAPVRFLIALRDVYAARAAWPAETLISRWHMSEPATAVGSEREVRGAFETAFDILHARVQRFLALPSGHLDDRALAGEIASIGQSK